MNRGGRRRPRLGKRLTRPLQGTPARPEARGRRGRRRGSSGTRRLDERWSGPRLRRGFGGDLARARGGPERERAAEMQRGVGGGRWGGGRGVEGGAEALSSRGGVDGEVVRRRRARSASPGQRNRREARFGELGRLGWVRWAGLLGWAEAQGEARGSPTPSSFLFLFFSFPAAFAFFFCHN